MNKSNIKTIVFVSNYFNHHQRPLADAFYEMYKDGYKFIETEHITEERKNMGWGEDVYPEYVVPCNKYAQNKEYYLNIIDNADVVIIGSAPNYVIENRIKSKKLVFRYSERPLKTNKAKWKNIIRFFTWRKFNPQNGHMHLICASAFASSDYAKLGMYKNKAYKWGYFTEVKKYDDVDLLISKKEPNSILWCGRFIDVKHPEAALAVAKRLKDEGVDFTLNIIGSGELEEQINQYITDENLKENVHMLGTMKPEEVREYMEKSEIFLFTSDKGEGWGAVLNESMNSACAVLASHAIGSVPFLIDNNNDGLIYKDGNTDDLYQKVKSLIDNPTERKKIAKNAYLTMANEWNAKNASQKFSKIAECILNGENPIHLFETGVCSRAEILKDNWFRIEKER